MDTGAQYYSSFCVEGVTITRYQFGNCLFEAAYEKIVETCQCLPSYHVAGGEYQECQGDNKTCMNKILARIGQ